MEEELFEKVKLQAKDTTFRNKSHLIEVAVESFLKRVEDGRTA